MKVNSVGLKPFYNSDGATRLKSLTILFVITGIVYVIIHVAPVWIDHYGIKDEIDQLALYSSCRKPDEAKQAVLKIIKSYPLTTVKDDQVSVSCDKDILQIHAAYQRRLELPGYSRTFSFNIETGARRL